MQVYIKSYKILLREIGKNLNKLRGNYFYIEYMSTNYK